MEERGAVGTMEVVEGDIEDTRAERGQRLCGSGRKSEG